jgi:lambda family phage portal protein
MNQIHEYETSELMAARIAASLTGALKTEYADSIAQADEGPRELDLQPGMILDNLRPGESLEIFSHNRPSPTLEAFRNGQLRAASAGIGLSYSALSRDYNGTYSAQRQELVEQFDAYRMLSSRFIGQVAAPIWRLFVALAIQSGVVKPPKEIAPATIDVASFIPPVIPWIDPQKEANAHQVMLDNYLVSPQSIIRQRGGNPDEVLTNWQRWNDELKRRGLESKQDKINESILQD